MYTWTIFVLIRKSTPHVRTYLFRRNTGLQVLSIHAWRVYSYSCIFVHSHTAKVLFSIYSSPVSWVLICTGKWLGMVLHNRKCTFWTLVIAIYSPIKSELSSILLQRKRTNATPPLSHGEIKLWTLGPASSSAPSGSLAKGWAYNAVLRLFLHTLSKAGLVQVGKLYIPIITRESWECRVMVVVFHTHETSGDKDGVTRPFSILCPVLLTHTAIPRPISTCSIQQYKEESGYVC